MDMHDRFRKMAIKNLAPRSKGGKGFEVTLSKRITGEFNPSTGVVEDDREVKFEGSAIRTSFRMHSIDGNLIKVDDVLLYLSPILIDGTECPAPVHGDIVTFKQQDFVVMSHREWDFAGVPCGWRVQARIGG